MPSRARHTPRRAALPASDARAILAFPARESYVTAPHVPPSPAEPLEFRGATKRYPGATETAVDALTLEVPAGEICVLVGPSGCGKTTAMRMVNRMIDITEGD